MIFLLLEKFFKQATNFSLTWDTCGDNSLVGVFLLLMIRSTQSITNAHVSPEPVWASPTMLSPETAIVHDCAGLGRFVEIYELFQTTWEKLNHENEKT